MTLRENAISVCCCFSFKVRTSTPIFPARYTCTFSQWMCFFPIGCTCTYCHPHTLQTKSIYSSFQRNDLAFVSGVSV